MPDGTEAEMEVVRHPGAAAAVPLHTGGGEPEVTLIRQYRYAADGEILEVPAGKLEEDEEPAACARRELVEEVGLRASEVHDLTSLFTTPGFTDERMYLFVATGLEHVGADHQDHEFIEVERVSLERALEMAARGEIEDGKSVAALFLAERWLRNR